LGKTPNDVLEILVSYRSIPHQFLARAFSITFQFLPIVFLAAKRRRNHHIQINSERKSKAVEGEPRTSSSAF
jgi:hypothetical protein